jgi:hypothetical protein
VLSFSSAPDASGGLGTVRRLREFWRPVSLNFIFMYLAFSKCLEASAWAGLFKQDPLVK